MSGIAAPCDNTSAERRKNPTECRLAYVFHITGHAMAFSFLIRDYVSYDSLRASCFGLLFCVRKFVPPFVCADYHSRLQFCSSIQFATSSYWMAFHRRKSTDRPNHSHLTFFLSSFASNLLLQSVAAARHWPGIGNFLLPRSLSQLRQTDRRRRWPWPCLPGACLPACQQCHCASRAPR